MRPLRLSLLLASPLFAQAPVQNIRIVLPNGPGAITASLDNGWQYKMFELYDDSNPKSEHRIYRPVLLLHNDRLDMNLSYILYANDTKAPTAEGCRESAVVGALKGIRESGNKPTSIKDSSYTTADGRTLAVNTQFYEQLEKQPYDFQDIHAAIGDSRNCAIIHVSKEHYKPSDEKLFDALLDHFTLDTNYIPQSADYAALATLLTDGKQPRIAQIYLDRAVASGGSGLQLDPMHLPSQPFTLALVDHPGYLHFEAPTYAITELSAKPDGHEFGIRAREKSTGMEALGFLYLPNPAPITAVGCRDWQMKSEGGGSGYRKFTGKREFTSASGAHMAIAEFEQSKKPGPYRYSTRVFVAQGDLCADIAFTGTDPVTSAVIDPILSTLVFDPGRPSDFFAKFRYATVLFEHKEFAAAAPVFESALTLVSTVDDPSHWRRVATDQASMAYGMAGDLKHSRALNEAAILKDPDYPLYYYNLACADAEVGDAIAARKHLQQALDRRANTLKGESLPDPATDDSILKLRNDKTFWAFVESLPKS
jgi:tetratricopeptide (TPR) repeat protein